MTPSEQPSTDLPSWADTRTRASVLEFVAAVCDSNGDDFVPPEERIAVFDNDGTLWCERPAVQGVFIMDRLAEMADRDPSLRDQQPWKAAHEGDANWLGQAIVKHYEGDASDVHVLLAGVLRAFADVTVEEFQQSATAFFETARHPTYDRSFLETAYVPMLELLELLGANGFTCYIVTGGGRDFLRPVAHQLYGIPPERVIGSSSGLEIKRHDGHVMLMRSDEMGIMDDGDAKPIQIWERVGRRPILAAGNANGDVPMLEFTEAAPNRTLCLLIRHDDAEREVDSDAGAEQALTTAKSRDWTLVSMCQDWTGVFPTPTSARR
jgi:phosphoglycolate phosphatase-like HAD superfamily hydrolase